MQEDFMNSFSSYLGQVSGLYVSILTFLSPKAQITW